MVVHLPYDEDAEVSDNNRVERRRRLTCTTYLVLQDLRGQNVSGRQEAARWYLLRGIYSHWI